MELKSPHEAINKLIRTLGLDPMKTCDLSVSISPGDIVTVTSTQYVEADEIEELVEIIDEYDVYLKVKEKEE